MMHENTSLCLNEISRFIEIHNLDINQSIKLLRDCALQLEAQSKVVEIREQLLKGKI